MVAYIVVLLVYFICPKYLRLVIFIINLIVPDSIPAVDEVIMIAGLFTSE